MLVKICFKNDADVMRVTLFIITATVINNRWGNCGANYIITVYANAVVCYALMNKILSNCIKAFLQNKFYVAGSVQVAALVASHPATLYRCSAVY
jgi:hypothetical protein